LIARLTLVRAPAHVLYRALSFAQCASRLLAVVVVAVAFAAPARAQELVATPDSLRFKSDPPGVCSSPTQVIYLERRDHARVPWTAITSADWLTVTPTSGVGPARIAVTLKADQLSKPSTAAVRIHLEGNAAGTLSDQQIAISASRLAAADAPPFGAFDAPSDGPVRAGRVRLSGWALDDLGVTDIEICTAAAVASHSAKCADARGVRLGFAAVRAIDRPDVVAAVPGLTHAGLARQSNSIAPHMTDPSKSTHWPATALDTSRGWERSPMSSGTRASPSVEASGR
jgi:Viral BACON domain